MVSTVIKSCFLFFASLLFLAQATADESALIREHLYQMTQLSIPERSQQSFVNKVTKQLNTPNLDSESLALANILMADYHIQNNDVTTARRYLNIAKPLVAELQLTPLTNEYQYTEMYILRDEGELSAAKQLAIELYKTNQDSWSKSKLSELILERIYIATLTYQYDEAINLMEPALNLAMESADPYQLTGTYNVFGILHSRLSNNQAAVNNFQKAVDVMEKNPVLAQNVYIYSNLADSYRRIENYTEAQKYLETTFKLAREEGNLSAEAYSYQIQSRLREDQELYELSIESLNKAYELMKQIGEDLFASQLHVEFTNIYLKINDIEQAEHHLNLAASLSETAASYQQDIKELRARIYYQKHDYQHAYDTLMGAFDAYKKSINERVTHISTIAARELEKEHLNYQNQLLSNENALAAEKLEQEKRFNLIMMVFVGLLLLLALVLSWALLRYKKTTLQLRKSMLTDSLTQLPSRRQMFRTLEKHHRSSNKTNNSYAIILLDIDHFKHINDRFGHAIGDKVIQTTRDICQILLRDDDTIGRIAGEEFLIILPRTDIEQAQVVAQRIMDSFATYDFDAISQGLRVTASFGVTEYMLDDQKLDHVINRADRLLHHAKKNGRNQICTTLN